MDLFTHIWGASCVMDGTREKELTSSIDEERLAIISDILKVLNAIMSKPLLLAMSRSRINGRCNYDGNKEGDKEDVGFASRHRHVCLA